MKEIKKVLLYGALTLCFLIPLVSTALASAGAPPRTPIDGGLSLLLAAGGIYGVKKLRELRKTDSIDS